MSQPILNNQPLSLKYFRSTTVSSTAEDVFAGVCNLYAVNILNNEGVPVYVKFYDRGAAAVAPATDKPFLTLLVQGDTGPKPGGLLLRGSDLPWHFGSSLSVRCVTGFGDTDTTSPTTKPIIEIATSL